MTRKVSLCGSKMPLLAFLLKTAWSWVSFFWDFLHSACIWKTSAIIDPQNCWQRHLFTTSVQLNQWMKPTRDKERKRHSEHISLDEQILVEMNLVLIQLGLIFSPSYSFTRKADLGRSADWNGKALQEPAFCFSLLRAQIYFYASKSRIWTRNRTGNQTSTLSQHEGRAPQPSIRFSCQAGGGFMTTTMMTHIWLH